MLRGTNANSANSHASSRYPLRVFGFGTIFVTQRLLLNAYPEAGSVARAHNVHKTRGGHSANVLAILAQFRLSRHPTPGSPPLSPLSSVRMIADVQFCGPLSGTEEGAMISKELDSQGISTMFSVTREGKNVPTAWVIEAADGTRTVINHNPLPDMTHEEFVSRLGPVLAPENYDILSNTSPSYPIGSAPPSTPSHGRRHSGSGPQTYGSSPNGISPPPNMSSLYQQFIIPGMPPFDWMHFEGRSPNTLHANLTGLDGLARERGWRSKSVFSLQISRTGVEPLMQHADVIFFSKPYAQAVSPSASPRAFLISMCTHASPNALLVADWGAQGAALLSVPTREYFQSSGWVEPTIARPSWNVGGGGGGPTSSDPGSIISGSGGFWADGRSSTGDSTGMIPTDTNFNTANHHPTTPSTTMTTMLNKQTQRNSTVSDIGSESSTTSVETEKGTPTFVDEVGAHDAFVAGMIFALSQRILPGRPYTSNESGVNGKTPAGAGGKWKLEECLRFATELAGRKGRKTGLQGLRSEMERGGWSFE